MGQPEDEEDPMIVAVLKTLGIDSLRLAPGATENDVVEITTEHGTVIAIRRRTEQAG